MNATEYYKCLHGNAPAEIQLLLPTIYNVLTSSYKIPDIFVRF